MITTRNHDLRLGRSRRTFLALVAAAAALPLMTGVSRVGAEESGQQPGQIPLTAKHVEQYLAAYKELAPLFDKLDQAGDKPDPKLMQMVEATVKKFGFASLDDYDAVANSIVAVLDGVDPKTKEYTDPVVSIKQAIADIQKDKSMKPADRKKAIAELNAELKEVQPVQHKGNIALVLKYYDQLAALTPQQSQ
jgi:hypothetical protein